MSDRPEISLYQRLRQRGVIRAAVSYLVIAWLVIQIGDVVLDPLGAPDWTMRLLIVLAVIGFPVAIALAWFLELTPAGLEIDTRDEGAARPGVRGLRGYADIFIIGVLLVVIAFLLIEPAESEPPVVAVLPFEELDSTAGSSFGDGFADSLIHKLGILDQLVVLAPASTFQFRGIGDNLADAAKKLGASVILHGSLRRAGGLLRIDARLVDGASRQLLWSGNFRRPLDDVFQLQEEIASAVANSLGVKLTREQVERIARPPTENLNAYTVYIRGSREALDSRDNDRVLDALQFLLDAIEIDPDFALAHATLVEAMYLVTSYRHWETKWEDFRDDAYAAAKRAQELDPTLGEAYLAEAIAVHTDRYKDIEPQSDEHLIRLLEKALQYSPSNVMALKLLSEAVDDPDRKMALMKRAARIDPRSGIVRVNIAEFYARRGDFAQAEYWSIQAGRAQEPFFRLGYKFLIDNTIWGSTNLERAARWGRAFYRKYPDDWAPHVSYLRALLELGAWPEAHTVLTDTARLAEDDPYYLGWVNTYIAQWLAFAEGDFNLARELAERHKSEYLHTLPSWPDLSGTVPPLMSCIQLLALLDVIDGEPTKALERFRYSNLGPESLTWENYDVRGVRPPVLYAVLHRHTGDPERANKLLRDILDDVADVRLHSIQGKGLTEFSVHAFLGDADAAATALQRALDANWIVGWWSFDIGRFDDNYSAVLDDPRVQALRAEMEARAKKMLASFRANPDLPEETLAEAGLL